MFNKILRITLAVFVLTYFVSSVYASDSESSGHGPHDKLDRAIRNEGNAEREAQKQFDTLQDVNRLVGDLGIAYSAKSEAIAKGKTVTIAAGVGAIGSAVLTGGVTAPTVTGIIGAALSLGMSWKGYDNLLYRYNEALELKVSQIEKTKNAIDTYDEVYNDQYLVERSNHLNAVTTHNQYHHKPPITKWSRTPDYSLPSFRCGGDCRQSFSTPLGDHGEVCGLGSEVPGCHKVWYSCVSADVRKHSPVRCTLDYKVYRKLPNHKKELFVTRTCPDQFRPCMTFDLGYHEEVHYGSLDSSGRFRYDRYYGRDKIIKGQQTKHNHNPNVTIRPYQTLNLSVPAPTDNTPNCSDCTSDCSSPCSCTNTGTCGGTPTDGTPNCMDCTSDCSSPCSCTNSGTCGGTPTDGTPNCMDCTSDCSSPCSCTNSGTCGGTPSTPAPAPTPTPTPEPMLVSCGRSGCTETVSSSTAHQVTCSAGHQYWSCGQYASWHANHHRTRTCRYGQCRQSWQRCSRPSSAPTPMCNSPARTGQRCWAQ